MLKKSLIVFVVSMMLVLGLILVINDKTFAEKNISDSFFVVGIFMFFTGLMTITNAGRVFSSFGYFFINLFNGQKRKYRSYFEYVTDKNSKKKSPVGIPIFLLSICYIGISVYLALRVMS